MLLHALKHTDILLTQLGCFEQDTGSATRSSWFRWVHWVHGLFTSDLEDGLRHFEWETDGYLSPSHFQDPFEAPGVQERPGGEHQKFQPVWLGWEMLKRISVTSFLRSQRSRSAKSTEAVSSWWTWSELTFVLWSAPFWIPLDELTSPLWVTSLHSGNSLGRVFHSVQMDVSVSWSCRF